MEFIEEKKLIERKAHLSLLESKFSLACKDTMGLMINYAFNEIMKYVRPIMSASYCEVIELNNNRIDYFLNMTQFTVHYLVSRSKNNDNIVILYEDDRRSEFYKIKVANNIPLIQNQILGTEDEITLKIQEIKEKIGMVKQGKNLYYELIRETEDGEVLKGRFTDIHDIIYDMF